MEQKILQAYQKCIRFDEGTLRKTGGHKKIVAEKERLRLVLVDTYGPHIAPLLEEYTAVLYEEMELEAQHYFEQGVQVKQ